MDEEIKLNIDEIENAKRSVGSRFRDGKPMTLKDILEVELAYKTDVMQSRRDALKNDNALSRLNDTKKREYIRKMINKYALINTFNVKGEYDNIGYIKKTIVIQCVVILNPWSTNNLRIETKYITEEHIVSKALKMDDNEHEEILVNLLIDKIIVGDPGGYSYYLDEFFLDIKMELNEHHIFSCIRTKNGKIYELSVS